MRPVTVLRSVGSAGLAITAALTVPAATASAAAQTASIPAGSAFDLGPSPVPLPAACPFANGDANFVFMSGSAVSYGTENANGDWGGETLTGPAVLFEDTTAIAAGHLTIWFGGGNNARGQSEGALTVNFAGSGSDGTVELHVSGQMAVNALGRPTANPLNVHVTCS